MGSPLGPTFANIFLSYHKQNWLKNCPCEFKLSSIKDMLMTLSCYFNQKIILKNFDVTLITKILILSLHLIEENNSISFLNIEIRRVTIVFLQIFI